jgi:alpha-beta hydrolase superfamily lysophospholipase
MSASAPIAVPDAVVPEPLWFGNDGAAAFGMLHAPAEPSTRGVIFCNALGFEGMLAHRAFRYIAEDVTALGLWSLRFDYYGEGDSAGGAWDPDRVDAWLASIDAAVGVLRARGVTDIRLVGFRMGATLASLYATSHPGVSAMVLWSPCTKGKTHTRELRALSRLAALARPAQQVAAEWFPEDALEIAAFEMSGETLQAISEIDLVAAPLTVCPPSVLVVDRDDAAANDALVQKLSDAGARVDHEQLPGYADFMTDSDQSSVIPETIVKRIAEWLVETDPVAPAVIGANAAPLVLTDHVAIDDPTAGLLPVDGPLPNGVCERAVWIDARFFAVVSSPDPSGPVRRAAIVLCNTGYLNRTGPGRLHVNLARYWAGLGFTVVRVDLGGCGDTFAVTPAAVSEMYAMREEDFVLAPTRTEELGDIVRWVRDTTGLDQVVAGGLCSGAYNAFQVALNGTRLDDILMINPGTFYVSAGEIPVEETIASAHILTRGFFNGRKWKLALHDRDMRRHGFASIRRLFRDKPISGMRVLAVQSVKNKARRVGLPVKHTTELARDLDTIISGGGRIFLAFSPEEYADRYFRVFGGPACQEIACGDGLDLEYIDGGDHTFAPPGARQVLIERMTGYLEQRYPAASAAAAVNPASETRRVSGSRGPRGLSAL